MLWTHRYQKSIWNEIILALLGVLSVGLLIYEFSSNLSNTTRAWFYGIDKVIACIFLFDFFTGLHAAQNKAKYWKSNWYLLLASIPFSEGVFQSLRALRILRLITIFRLIARIKNITVYSTETIDSMFRYAHVSVVVIVIVLAGATAFYTVEADVHPSVNNFFDALWWSAVTTTTVGYGDIYPLTWQGRMVAMVLMFVGIGVVGTVAGMVGGGIVNRHAKK